MQRFFVFFDNHIPAEKKKNTGGEKTVSSYQALPFDIKRLLLG